MQIIPFRKAKRKQASGLELARRRAKRAFDRIWASQNKQWGQGSPIQDSLYPAEAFDAYFTAWLHGGYDEGNMIKRHPHRYRILLDEK